MSKAATQLHVISFGYGHDTPPAADITCDVREWFRDPHLKPEMRFMTGRANAAPIQIAWEYQALWSANITLFWFPATDPAVTVQPIALYELGAAATPLWRRIIVGAAPGYPRRLDVVEQLRHARPGILVHDTLQAVIDELRAAVA